MKELIAIRELLEAKDGTKKLLNFYALLIQKIGKIINEMTKDEVFEERRILHVHKLRIYVMWTQVWLLVRLCL